jgi:Kelch motif
MSVLGALASALVLAGGWQARAPLPVARSEVAGARWRGYVAVVGGFLADGRSSARVDLYNARTGQRERLPDLPVAVNHPMAAAGGGRLYALGGYGSSGARRDAFVYDGRRRPLREHLGVTALRRRLYVLGGRANGQTFATVQRWVSRRHRWQLRAPLPEPRGGTAAGVAAGWIVSAGGESSAGTSAAVYAYDAARNSWALLPNLPTPRHGLAVVGVGSTIFVIGGGPVPGLSVSTANESLDLD